MSRQYIVDFLGSNEEADKFELWAFGQYVSEMSLMDIPSFWNKTHGDLFIINESHEIYKSIHKMLKAFEEYNMKSDANDAERGRND